MILIRYSFALVLFGALLQPISTQVLWYYVTPFLSTRGVSILRSNGTGLPIGNIQFSQNTLYGPVIIQGAISGLSPGLHRVVINRFGDVTNGCLSIGPLFNPEQAPNGWTTGITRPIGDLGVIQAGQNGIAQIALSDNIITLHGRNNVIGRSLAIYEFAGQVTSGTNIANVGSTLACGVIGLAAEIP